MTIPPTYSRCRRVAPPTRSTMDVVILALVIEQMKESGRLQQVTRPIPQPSETESLPPAACGLQDLNQDHKPCRIDVNDDKKIPRKNAAERSLQAPHQEDAQTRGGIDGDPARERDLPLVSVL